MSDVCAILRAAAVLIARGYSRGAVARCERGKPCSPLSTRARFWSLDGAIARACADTGLFSPIQLDGGNPDFISFARNRFGEWTDDDRARSDAFDKLRGDCLRAFGWNFDVDAFDASEQPVGVIIRRIEKALKDSGCNRGARP